MNDAAPPTGRRRWLRVAVGVALVAAALIGWALIPPSMQPLDDELVRLRAAGFPTTCAEALGEMPPDAENGALDLEAALAALEDGVGKVGTWKVTGPWDRNATAPWPESATPQQITELGAFLGRARPFFDRVDAGLAKPRFRFRDTLDAAGLPTQAYVRNLQHVLMVVSARALAGATPDERIAGVSSLARLGRRIEPNSMIPALVGIAATASAVSGARHAVEDGSVPVADLRRALDPDLLEPRLDILARAAPAEAAWFAAVYRGTQSGVSSSQIPSRPSWNRRLKRRVERLFGKGSPLEWDELRPAEAARVVRVWSEVAALDASSARGLHASIDALKARNAPVPADVMIVLLQVERKLVQSEAKRRLARVALAAAERRETTGAWPASLDELRDAFPDGVPLDPYTDAPFVYDASGAKVRLASAGALPGAATPDDATLREQLLLWEVPR